MSGHTRLGTRILRGEKTVRVKVYQIEQIGEDRYGLPNWVYKKPSKTKERIGQIVLKHLPGEHDQLLHGDREYKVFENIVGEIDRSLLKSQPGSKKMPFADIHERVIGFINPEGDAIIGKHTVTHDDWAKNALDINKDKRVAKGKINNLFENGYIRFDNYQEGRLVLEFYSPIKTGAKRSIRDYLLSHPSDEVAFEIYDTSKKESYFGSNPSLYGWGPEARDRFENIIGISTKERLKHLPGQHNQKRHGWRYGGAQDASKFETPGEHQEFTRRLQSIIGDRTRYAQANANIRNARNAYATYDIRRNAVDKAYRDAVAAADDYRTKASQVNHYALEQDDIYNKKLDEANKKIQAMLDDPNYDWDELKKLRDKKAAMIKKYYGTDFTGGIIGKLRQEGYDLEKKREDAQNKANAAYTASMELMKARPTLDGLDEDIKTSMEIGMKLGAKKRQAMMAKNARIEVQHTALNIEEADLAKQRTDLGDKYKAQYGDDRYFDYLREDPAYATIRNKQAALGDKKEMLGASKKEKELFKQERAIQAQADKIRLNSDAEREQYTKLTDQLIQVQSQRSELYASRKQTERSAFYSNGAPFDFLISSQHNFTTRDYKDGIDFVSGVVGDNILVKQNTVEVYSIDEYGDSGSLDDRDRSFAHSDEIYLAGKTYANNPTLVHEMGHVIESRDSLIHGEIVKFLNKRIAGQSTIKLNTTNPAYKDYEVTVTDHFYDPYIGKIYKSGDNIYASEVLSMGIQGLYQDATAVARRDPEYFDFIYALMKMGN
jgi:hypothetical protein